MAYCRPYVIELSREIVEKLEGKFLYWNRRFEIWVNISVLVSMWLKRVWFLKVAFFPLSYPASSYSLPDISSITHQSVFRLLWLKCKLPSCWTPACKYAAHISKFKLSKVESSEGVKESWYIYVPTVSKVIYIYISSIWWPPVLLSFLCYLAQLLWIKYNFLFS